MQINENCLRGFGMKKVIPNKATKVDIIAGPKDRAEESLTSKQKKAPRGPIINESNTGFNEKNNC